MAERKENVSYARRSALNCMWQELIEKAEWLFPVEDSPPESDRLGDGDRPRAFFKIFALSPLLLNPHLIL